MPSSNRRLNASGLVAALAALTLIGVPAPGSAAETAQWAPFISSSSSGELVTCAWQSPGSFCDGHHSWPAVDFDLTTGEVVRAAGPGTIYARKTGCIVGVPSCGDGYGNYVVIRHTGGGYSIYGHLSSVSVTVGVSVALGQSIGRAGNTGDSTGDHLHYEERNSFGCIGCIGNAVDPGIMYALHGSTTVSYPGYWSKSSWKGLAGITFRLRNDDYPAPCTLASQLSPAQRIDLNGAGRDDVAVLRETTDGTVQVDSYFGRNDAQAFVSKMDAGNGIRYSRSSILGTAAGDFNEDGMSDVAIVVAEDATMNRIDVLLSQEDLTFERQQWYRGSAFVASNIRAILSGDYNNDGDSDVFILTYDAGTTTFKIQNFRALVSEARFVYETSYDTVISSGYNGTKVLHAAAGDFNGDCKSDIATFYDYGNSETRIHMFLMAADNKFAYQGSAGWWRGTSYSLPGLAHVTGGDFNNDGLSDIAAMYDGSTVTRFHIFESSGSALAADLYKEMPDAAGFYAPRVQALVPGRFDAGTTTDLMAVYREVGGEITLRAFRSTGSALTIDGAWATDRASYKVTVRGAAPPSTRQRTDSTLPLLSSTRAAFDPAESSGDWTRGSWRVALTCSDQGSLCEPIRYAIDDGAERQYDGEIVVTAEGRHTLKFSSEDGAGNPAETSVVVGVDRTAPASTVEPPAAIASSGEGVAVTATAVDPEMGMPMGASGVKEVSFTLCSVLTGACLTKTDTDRADGWGTTFDRPAGIYTVTSTATDVAGNREAAQLLFEAVVIVAP